MTPLADEKARLRALTDLLATLLVEAAAGTGKTALMAGRLTMLLASGVEPGNVAAITFTELAASELATRVHRFIDELLAGRMPDAMIRALPGGLDEPHRAALTAAAGKLDELTITTIHGFCQAIIHSYAVEADIDPGAQILDAANAESAFESVFEQWLRRRLAGPASAGDPIVTLSRDEPRRIVPTLHKLACLRRDHRSARSLPADLSGRPDIDLVDAVSEFERWLAQSPAEPKTAEMVGELETLATFYADSVASLPDFPQLWQLAHPPRLACMRGRDSFDLKPYRCKTAWEKAAGKAAGARLNEQAEILFGRVNDCYRELLGRIATALIAILSHELDEVLRDYESFKRAAAVLDFDDLLHRACALVRKHEPVRRDLGARYRHIFVDEFQDTDPIQAEILFLIAADDRPGKWQEGKLRPGALFMVGDPKQAIYRFRGADIGSYGQAREAIKRSWPDNIIQITANFRSRPDILTHVNKCFAAPLNATGQPGYVPLEPTLPPSEPDAPCVVKLKVDLPLQPSADVIRDEEAAAVAALCARLIGCLTIRDPVGNEALLAPSDIALLAPTGTELWRYEAAFERQGLPIASQAGKGFFRRQEIQDLLALTRTLADARDTLALGALLRGPLVGLTEEELLDITAALPARPDQLDALPRLSLLTDPALVAHPGVRDALSVLRNLRRRSRYTAPMLLLSEAIERLTIRPILATRDGDHRARATANVDALLELARPYAVKGLKRFAHDLSKKWELSQPWSEGTVDAESNTIQVTTMHSAKGLEWPVVIPINTATLRRSREPFVHRPADDTLHWLLGDVVPPELDRALQADEESLAREQERLLYVACTRARDLLILPELSGAGQNSWARIVDLGHRELPTIDLSRLVPGALPRPQADPPNPQTADIFEAQRVAINDAVSPLSWLRPSDGDLDRMPITEVVAIDVFEAPEGEMPVGPGRVRGLILHKLMEEILTGEIAEEAQALASRAEVLMRELVIDSTSEGKAPSKDEIARTVLKTLGLPDITALRPALVPELPVYDMFDDGQTALAGRADAVALEDGIASAVLDWKSDIAPTNEDIQTHAAQLRQYMTAVGAARGALVYMTSGTVHWIGGQ
jgi:ATP-dependent exoDNAse (exonuclease V) beta subunit